MSIQCRTLVGDCPSSKLHFQETAFQQLSVDLAPSVEVCPSDQDTPVIAVLVLSDLLQICQLGKTHAVFISISVFELQYLNIQVKNYQFSNSYFINMRGYITVVRATP